MFVTSGLSTLSGGVFEEGAGVSASAGPGFLRGVFGIGRSNSAVHARVLTNLAAFVGVTCVVTLGPGLLANFNTGNNRSL